VAEEPSPCESKEAAAEGRDEATMLWTESTSDNRASRSLESAVDIADEIFILEELASAET